MMLKVVMLAVWLGASATALGQARDRQPQEGPAAALSAVLGRPTDHSITISVLSRGDVLVYAECGVESGKYTIRTKSVAATPGQPVELVLDALRPATRYVYRINTRSPNAPEFHAEPEQSFHTRRAKGESFVFALQGDSHPERLGKMYDPDLYVQTMRNVSKDAPDFYFTMGDDFSIERLIEQKTLSQRAVDAIYAHQRGFLGLVGASAPLMLVNGNHEQAAKYLLDGTAKNAAVFAGTARTKFFPLPAPDGFYTGNAEPVEHIGLLRDYYAWEWGDALFVVIDPYWHSDVPVDNEAGTRAPRPDAGRDPAKPGESNRDGKRRGRDTGNGGGGGGGGGEGGGDQPPGVAGKGRRDLWQITLGDTQYRWLRTTLTQSEAKFKFVFSHHVLGTGRGGVEQAGKFEWGGNDQRGFNRFFQMRPKWEQPIHDLMRDSGVTIFFQGHDHLYAHQQLDGVTYQEVPNPADPTFTAFNRQAYTSGDIFPNSGHLRVTVSADEAKVEYVRSFRKQDEHDGVSNESIAHSYTVKPRAPVPAKEQRP